MKKWVFAAILVICIGFIGYASYYFESKMIKATVSSNAIEITHVSTITKNNSGNISRKLVDNLPMNNKKYYYLKNSLEIRCGLNVDAIILGDSISVSQGASDSNTTGWNINLSNNLNKRYGANINWINKGLSGETVDYCLQRAQEITSDTDIVFICVGRNDRNIYTPEQFKEKYTLLINNINKKAPLADIFCIIEPPMVSNDESKFLGIRNAILEVADKTNSIPVDVWSTFLNNMPKDNDEFQKLTIDGLHLNDKGYEIMSNYIFNLMSELLYSGNVITT